MTPEQIVGFSIYVSGALILSVRQFGAGAALEVERTMAPDHDPALYADPPRQLHGPTAQRP